MPPMFVGYLRRYRTNSRQTTGDPRIRVELSRPRRVGCKVARELTSRALSAPANIGRKWDTRSEVSMTRDVAPRSRYVMAGHVRTRWRGVGDGDVPVVLVHGGGVGISCDFYFESILPHLGQRFW